MKTKKEFVLFFSCAMFGGLCRYYGGILLSKVMPSSFATILLNFLGLAILLLFVKGLLQIKNASKTLVFSIGTGFCGAFTTLSSSLLDGLKLLEIGYWLGALIHFSTLILGGIIIAYLSVKLVEEVA